MIIKHNFSLSGRLRAVVLTLLFGLSSLWAEPLTEQQLTSLIQAGFPTSEVKEMVEKRGYAGPTESENLKALREAGADAELIVYLTGRNEAATVAPQAPVRLLRFSNGEKFGFSDPYGRVIIEPKWDEAGDFSEGLARVRRGELWGFIDETGRIMSDIQWDDAKNFKEGRAVVWRDNKFGYIDQTGRIVIEPTWSVADPFTEGLAQVVNDSFQYGFIDKTGRIVIQPQWSAAISLFTTVAFSEGLAMIVDEEFKIGFIDQAGRVVIPPKWSSAGPFVEGLAWVKDGDKYGFIDKTGHVVVDLKWDGAKSFSEDLALVKRGDKYGYIDKTGRVAIEPEWSHAISFSEGLAAVVVGEKYGFIDPSGRMIIKPQFDTSMLWTEDVASFSEGLAVFKQDKQYGYIDISGLVVIEPKWDDAEAFSQGFATVERHKKVGAIDRDGNIAAGFGKVIDFSAFVEDHPLPRDKALAVWSKAQSTMVYGDDGNLTEVILLRLRKLLAVKIPWQLTPGIVAYYKQQCTTDFTAEAKLPFDKRVELGIARGDFTQREIVVAGMVLSVMDNFNIAPANGIKNRDDYKIALALRFHYSEDGIPSSTELPEFCIRASICSFADFIGIAVGSPDWEDYIAETTSSADARFNEAVTKYLRELTIKQ